MMLLQRLDGHVEIAMFLLEAGQVRFQFSHFGHSKYSRLPSRLRQPGERGGIMLSGLCESKIVPSIFHWHRFLRSMFAFDSPLSRCHIAASEIE